MRSRREPVAAAVLVATALALSACGGGDATVDELTVSGAWARPTPAGASNGVVYLTIASPADDVLVDVDVPPEVAGDATMHESTGEGGADAHAGHGGGGDAPMAGMVEQGRVEVPAGEPVTFEPGGMHVMLTELAEPLVAGDRFTLTLDLERAGAVTTDVVVAVNAP